MRNKKTSFILGISCYFHDAAACLIKDGVVVAAAAEERFTRLKHDNRFPKHAIDFCLAKASIAANELEAIAFYEKPVVKFERLLSQHLQHFPKSAKQFFQTMPEWLNQRLDLRKTLQDELHYFGPLTYIDHHLSHAASAYYVSPFSEASIVSLDGVGEWATTVVGQGRGNQISIDREIRFPHSLGLLYSTLTTYLGFEANDAEYKVMGLAAYGDPRPYWHHFDHLIKLHDDGSYQLNLRYFDFDWAERMPSSAFVELFGLPARTKEGEVLPAHENIAASLQKKLEQVVFHLLRKVYQEQGLENLCLVGGVALNSVMNGKIVAHSPFKRVFIPPDPSDAGTCIGAALYTYFQLHPTQTKQASANAFQPYLGPDYLTGQIQQILDQRKLSYRFYDRESLLDNVSSLLTKQKVIGWFQGKMEWGPRALGHRSILAAADKDEMRDIINARVKNRELFRPFAPVILEEYVSEFFHDNQGMNESDKWMLTVYPIQEQQKKRIPAVTHVDGSGRLQRLARTDNELYYDLIDAYREKTGLPVIINTSFNVRGEPIVCTPDEAITCFLQTDIDYLVIDNFLVSK